MSQPKKEPDKEPKKIRLKILRQDAHEKKGRIRRPPDANRGLARGGDEPHGRHDDWRRTMSQQQVNEDGQGDRCKCGQRCRIEPGDHLRGARPL